MPRMNILNTVEREAFNSPPVFNSFQRKQYFDCSWANLVRETVTPMSTINLIGALVDQSIDSFAHTIAGSERN